MAAARRLRAPAVWDRLDEARPERLADEERPDDDLRDEALPLREPEDDPLELDDELLELEALRDEPDFRAEPPPLLLEELLRVWAI